MRPILPLVLLGILLTGSFPHPATARAATARTEYQRARAAYAGMQNHFAIGDGALYREHALPLPNDLRYSYAWPFSQAFTAALDIALLRDGDPSPLEHARFLGRSYFAHYWDTASRPPGGAAYPVTDGGGVKFYDDNTWIGLNLIEIFRATGDRRALDDAARIFGFIVSGWDTDPAHPAPGGIFWTQSADNYSHDRNTTSNAPTAQLALHLYALSGDYHYLNWAYRIFHWVERTMRDPADGLYWDRIQMDGWVEPTKWSYNQGAMLGAAALFYRYTGEEVYLERAREIAAAALAHYGEGDRLWEQEPAFNAIFFRNLYLLNLVTYEDRAFVEPLAAYAERAWMAGRNAKTGLVHFGRPGSVPLLNHAAAVQLFALLATLDTEPAPSPTRPLPRSEIVMERARPWPPPSPHAATLDRTRFRGRRLASSRV